MKTGFAFLENVSCVEYAYGSKYWADMEILGVTTCCLRGGTVCVTLIDVDCTDTRIADQ